MKRFEFTLRRVLEVRRQQAEIERSRLQSHLANLETLQNYRRATAQRADEARAFVKNGSTVSGEDLVALSAFEKHISRTIVSIDQQKAKLDQVIAQQQAKVLEAERKVKLLQNLEEKQLSEWTVLRDKEIEQLGADSHLARLLSERRVMAALPSAQLTIDASPDVPPEFTSDLDPELTQSEKYVSEDH